LRKKVGDCVNAIAPNVRTADPVANHIVLRFMSLA
jgi:hypothetical protein